MKLYCNLSLYVFLFYKELTFFCLEGANRISSKNGNIYYNFVELRKLFSEDYIKSQKNHGPLAPPAGSKTPHFF